MSLELARQKFAELTGNIVNDAALSKLHGLFPNEFEFYMIAFELEDGNGIVTDRFVMPIMPDNISYDNHKLTTIQKTAQGVSVLTNNSFVPRTINMDGSFGRWFKIMVGNMETASHGDLATSGGMYIPSAAFIPNIKTGYGAMKQFERLIDKSVTKNRDGSPRRLVFYNLSFNTQHIVKVMSFNPRMGMDMNMVWKYQLTMQAVAPANMDVGKRTGKTMLLMGISAVNTRINDIGLAASAAANTITPLL